MEEIVVHTRRGDVRLVRGLGAGQLEGLKMSEGLGIFFHYRYEDAERTKRLLIDLCSNELVTVSAAISGDTLAGYVTIVPAEESGRWGALNEALKELYPDIDRPILFELGSIEIGKRWRGMGLGTRLLEHTFGGAFDGAIVFLRELSWHWDTRETGLSIYKYRNMLFKMFECVGFEYFYTDEKEVAYSGENMFMARIGKDVPGEISFRFCKSLRNKRPGGWGWS
ncbi:hypothetical protein DRQ05_04320 [bacterium]|nr:MAG: hypothetical protein DRQ05_04320 [bacterium]